MSQIITALADVSDRYDALFCDLWGCLHNGITAFPEAVAALQAFRQKGGAVILVTNAPRQRASIENDLDRLNIPDDCWDAIATSGDSARLALFQGAIGDRVYFIGQPSDAVFFTPMKLLDDAVEIQRVELDQATGVLCCGPFDPHASPDTMRPTFLSAIARDLPMICANPDIVVDRGETREWCAGALAQLYTEMGGRAFYFGKPHPPIYDLARRRLVALGCDIPDDRILCVGDGIATDIAGAMGEGLESLFITGGLAAAETATRDQPDATALAEFLTGIDAAPTFAIGKLR